MNTKNTTEAALTVKAANDRASIRERAARFYTVQAAYALFTAGHVSALQARTACPADARARMVVVARAFYVAHRNISDSHRAVDGLIDAMRTFGLDAEANALAEYKSKL